MVHLNFYVDTNARLQNDVHMSCINGTTIVISNKTIPFTSIDDKAATICCVLFQAIHGTVNSTRFKCRQTPRVIISTKAERCQ